MLGRSPLRFVFARGVVEGGRPALYEECLAVLWVLRNCLQAWDGAGRLCLFCFFIHNVVGDRGELEERVRVFL